MRLGSFSSWLTKGMMARRISAHPGTSLEAYSFAFSLERHSEHIVYNIIQLIS